MKGIRRGERVKWVLGVAALVLAAGGWSTARAGNLNLAGCQYYSVLVHPGEAFSYTGSESNVTLTVDDITYTTQIDPCDLTQRCAFFSMSDFGGANDFNMGSSNGSGISPGGGVSYWTSAFSDKHSALVAAKGQYLRLEMSEGASAGFQVFDAVSHSVYGFLADKTHSYSGGGSTTTFYGVGPEQGATDTTSGGMTETDAMGLSTWATPTSESRHYQSPQIVQMSGGNKVWLSDVSGTGFGVYTNSYATVKGRVWIGSEGAPVENFDVTVSTP